MFTNCVCCFFCHYVHIYLFVLFVKDGKYRRALLGEKFIGEYGRIQSWPNLRHCTDICLEGLGKAQKLR
jgi:hypothetical protein